MNDSFENYDINTPIRVIEIFNSIDGEQPRMGEVTTFVRLAGCNLKCDYCDTKHSQNQNSGELTTVLELVKRIQKVRVNNNITLTGGEPLLQMGAAEELCHRLDALGCDINIETNGTIKPTLSLLTSVKRMIYDYKSSSLFNVTQILRVDDVVKFVIRNMSEFEEAVRVARELNFNKVYVGCVQGEDNVMSEEELINFIVNEGVPNLHFNTQLHKKIGVA